MLAQTVTQPKMQRAQHQQHWIQVLTPAMPFQVVARCHRAVAKRLGTDGALRAILTPAAPVEQHVVRAVAAGMRGALQHGCDRYWQVPCARGAAGGAPLAGGQDCLCAAWLLPTQP